MKLPPPDTYWACLFFPVLLSYIYMLQATVNKRPTMGSIERLDPTALATLIAPDACLEVIADGILWAEGPLWIPAEDDHG